MLTVRPTWLDLPLFSRIGEEGWRLNAEAVAKIGSMGTRIGLHASIPERDSWRGVDPLERTLTNALNAYVRAVSWWLPDTVPKASASLERIFDQLLRDGAWTWEDTFSAEHDVVDHLSDWQAEREEHAPWRDRLDRDVIEEMIIASGRVDPFRLRPLVLINENAGRRQWWYGGWAVYDVDAHGHVGALLAIYGKHARIPNLHTWMAPQRFDGPMPSSEDVRWYGYRFDDSYGQHADVLCALTGVSLYEGTHGVIANAPRPPEALVPEVPHSLATPRDGGDVLARLTVSAVHAEYRSSAAVREAGERQEFPHETRSNSTMRAAP